MTGTGGLLILVATPIGNLGDLSPRAVQTLQGADVIACEDTRHTRKLLSHAGIHGPHLVALHGHNEAALVGLVLRLLDEGRTVAVVSDAGMPGISDPGSRLVAGAAAAGRRVEVVPGPSAVVAALVVSGLPTDRWCFEGFLPARGGDRRARLLALRDETRTTVLYESPHRLAATLHDLADTCGPLRRVAIVRELTKIHEEVWRGTLEGASDHVARTEPRGEYVVVLAGAPPAAAASDADVEAALHTRLRAGLSAKQAVAEAAAELGIAKRRAYDTALRLQGKA